MNLEQRAQGYSEEEATRDDLIRGVINERSDLLVRGGRSYPFESKLKSQYIVEYLGTNDRYPIIDPNSPEIPLEKLAEHIRKQLPPRRTR
jgi:hypothetical protein